MAYEKQNFKDGQCLCGHHLNKMEDAIARHEDELEGGGFSPLVEITEIEGGHRVTITDKTGEHSYDVMDGASPSVSVSCDNKRIYYNAVNPDGSGSAVTIELPKDGKNGTNGADGADGVSPTIETTEIEGGHRVTITDVNGTQTFNVMDGEGGGNNLFTGTTSDTTPLDVATAIGEGKTVLINHTDNTYGLIFFANFTSAVSMGIIAASITIEYYGSMMNASLTGDIAEGTWTFAATELATTADIPEEKAVTAVDLSGYDSGTIVETYSDGSTLTYSLTFDSDGNITKITDSNGNETVLTW